MEIPQCKILIKSNSEFLKVLDILNKNSKISRIESSYYVYLRNYDKSSDFIYLLNKCHIHKGVNWTTYKLDKGKNVRYGLFYSYATFMNIFGIIEQPELSVMDLL